MQAESLDENFTLGLAVLLAGDFAILPPDTKLNKVAPPGWLSSGKSKGLLGLPTSFMLYLRLRFFLPSLRGVRYIHLSLFTIEKLFITRELNTSISMKLMMREDISRKNNCTYQIKDHFCNM